MIKCFTQSSAPTVGFLKLFSKYSVTHKKIKKVAIKKVGDKNRTSEYFTIEAGHYWDCPTKEQISPATICLSINQSKIWTEAPTTS
ncbi:MAG: hypothetical protein P8O06_01665 [Porticoccaceae bacterium]|nr:hypothetical protein [Porticoccaceae bacterium]